MVDFPEPLRDEVGNGHVDGGRLGLERPLAVEVESERAIGVGLHTERRVGWDLNRHGFLLVLVYDLYLIQFVNEKAKVNLFKTKSRLFKTKKIHKGRLFSRITSHTSSNMPRTVAQDVASIIATRAESFLEQYDLEMITSNSSLTSS